MRSMSDPVCGTVTVRSQKEKTLENTCSGFVVDSCTGYFLTHGTILSEHIEAKSKVFKELQRKSYCTEKQELKHLQMDVEVKLPKNVFPYMKSSRPNMELSMAPSSAVMEGLHGNQCTMFHGRVCSIFSVPSLKHILDRLMPSDNWEFGDEQMTNKNKKEKSDSLIFRELLSCFILVQLDDWVPFHSTLSIKSASLNSIGDPVEIISTPFGGLIPEVFLNARSAGIISNVAGKGKVLLMTDARCVPGSEGGILMERNSTRSVLGIIIATLCWKNSEWVGLSLACALPDIMTAIKAIPVNVSPSVLSFGDKCVSNLQQVLPSVPLISVRGSWGSGFTVGIHGNELILLTCNHVVKDCSYSSAKVKWPSGNIYSGKLIYRNHSTPTFDLALISVKVRSSDIPPTLQTAKIQEGDPVFGVGHAIFNEEYGLLASVTSGIVSKVHRMRNKIVMIQTTCAIHAGASGGPVVNKQGEVIGVTVCNAKDVTSGASYPHVNMCVPMETVSPIIQQFLETKDPSVLEGLQIEDPSVVGLWSLEAGPRAPLITSSKL